MTETDTHIKVKEPLRRAIAIFKSQEGLAAAIGGNVKQQNVSYWLKNRVPADICITIENITGGEVSKHDLRPDLFGRPNA